MRNQNKNYHRHNQRLTRNHLRTTKTENRRHQQHLKKEE
ncbi:hypothetical protein MTO96_043804, partial [Rhipicephalus appendiculatus]